MYRQIRTNFPNRVRHRPLEETLTPRDPSQFPKLDLFQQPAEVTERALVNWPARSPNSDAFEATKFVAVPSLDGGLAEILMT